MGSYHSDVKETGSVSCPAALSNGLKAVLTTQHTSIEKLSSSRRPGGAEVNLAKKYPEVTLTNISTALDLAPMATYNINALPMCRIGQR